VKESRVVETFDVEIPREEAYRLLGMHRKKREPMESVRNNFDLEFLAASDLIKAEAVSITQRSGISGSAFFDARTPITLVVCTIGCALEDRVAKLTHEDRVARAMFLDAIGSAAVEEVANQSNRQICEDALRDGLSPGPRVSPGYGGWKLEDQVWIFQELAPAEIGVTLGEQFMMMPRKSISYAVPLTGGAAQGKGRCVHCGLKDCAYRTE
jgi:cobalamin-dependent methionine synthase I